MRKKLFVYFITTFYITFIFSINIKNVSAQNTQRPIKNLATYQKELNNENKIIYLTFDDGPSNLVTDAILNTLKENNIKATFFLIGNQIDGLENVVKRINSEGHSIGLHTYTHKFRKIYAGNGYNFISEMLQSREKIKEVVGVSPNIIRFPGGSKKHLTESYLTKLHSHDFKIYDWNIETVDGLNPRVSPYKLYRQATDKSMDVFPSELGINCQLYFGPFCEAKLIKFCIFCGAKSSDFQLPKGNIS